MFGAFFYGFVDEDQVRSYKRISFLADKMDKNDFMMANSPYSLLYEKLVAREPAAIHLNSPSSPPMILKLPTHESDHVHREMELVGPHVTSDPSIEGIDEFGTNTFQIYIWMASPVVRSDSSSDLNARTDQQPANQIAPPPTPLAILNLASPANLQPQSHGDDGMETDTEFEELQAMRARQIERETQVQEDAEMMDATEGQDVVMKDIETVIINLSDDNEFDHCWEFDDNSEDSDSPPKVKEMKPVIAPSGVVVKVEKGWWAEDEERRKKRIARHLEREEKERERKQKEKELVEANAKLIRLELENKTQISAFSSQLEEMKRLISLQASQAWASSSKALPPPPPVLESSTPKIHVHHQLLDLPHSRVGDKEQATSSAQDDVIASTPAPYVPSVASIDQAMFEVLPQLRDVCASTDLWAGLSNQTFLHLLDIRDVVRSRTSGCLVGRSVCGVKLHLLGAPVKDSDC